MSAPFSFLIRIVHQENFPKNHKKKFVLERENKSWSHCGAVNICAACGGVGPLWWWLWWWLWFWLWCWVCATEVELWGKLVADRWWFELIMWWLLWLWWWWTMMVVVIMVVVVVLSWHCGDSWCGQNWSAHLPIQGAQLSSYPGRERHKRAEAARCSKF